MVPHSLNEQKCIGELVRAGCECFMRVEVKTSALTRCTHIALSVPSRVMQPRTPVLHKTEPVRDFPASAPWLIIKSQDPRPHTKGPLRGSCPCSCDTCDSFTKKPNTTQCPYGRSALANPTRLMWEQKENKKLHPQIYPCGL